MRIEKLVSGGQTGADRAALDVAIELGIETGGWVPRGRRAEDGAIPARYRGLVETESRDYAVRTERNVRDSDATLILAFGPPGGGTAWTRDCADRSGRPSRVIDLAALSEADASAEIRAWLDAVRPRVLNVAGPRASQEPRIAEATRAVLLGALAG